jgi:hypothetical protein
VKAFLDYKERSTVWKTDYVLAVCGGITRASGLEYIFTRKCPLPLVRQKYEEGQANQAGCLNLLTNAVIVWNTVYMQAALDAIQQEGYPVQEEDLAHLWPSRFAHIHRYGKYAFDVEAARTRVGLRPLKR